MNKRSANFRLLEKSRFNNKKQIVVSDTKLKSRYLKIDMRVKKIK